MVSIWVLIAKFGGHPFLLAFMINSVVVLVFVHAMNTGWTIYQTNVFTVQC